MPTEEEEEETLDVIDVGRLPRERKRALENEAAGRAEERDGTSTFFERSWRRAAPESLSEVHRAVDTLGAPRPRPPPAPTAPPIPEGLSAAEASALSRFLGHPIGAFAIAQRGERGLLIETEGRLLSVRDGTVRELKESSEPPATATVPDPTPSARPESLPPAATTEVGQVPEPETPAPPPAAPEAPAAPAEPAKPKGLRGKLPFGKDKPAPEEPAPPPSPPPSEGKPSRLSGLKGKLKLGRKKD